MFNFILEIQSFKSRSALQILGSYLECLLVEHTNKQKLIKSQLILSPILLGNLHPALIEIEIITYRLLSNKCAQKKRESKKVKWVKCGLNQEYNNVSKNKCSL